MLFPYKVDHASLEFKNGIFEDKFGAKIRITQQMGYASPSMAGAYPYGFHQGVDLVASVNDFVHVAPEKCKVLKAVKDQTNSTTGFGNYIDLAGLETGHGYRLAHHKEVFVSEGEIVEKGQDLGTEGNSGYQKPRAGWHLHFEEWKTWKRMSSSQVKKPVYTGQFVNPVNTILKDLPKEKEEFMFKEKFERLQHLFAELCVAPSPHLVEAGISEGLISREKVNSFLKSPVHYGMVKEIFEKLLHRPADKKGLEHWTTMIFTEAFRGIGSSDEFKEIHELVKKYKP